MNKTLLTSLAMILVVMLGACATAPGSSTQSRPARPIVDTPELHPEEIAIYDLLSKIVLQNNPIRVDVESVDGEFVRTDIPTSMIVVEEYTTIEFMGSSEYDPYMERRLASLLEDGFVELGDSDTFSAFVENNRADYRITGLDPTVVTMSSAIELGEYDGPAGYWAAFYDAVPEAAGRLTFSRVGLSGDETIALVSITQRFSGFSGRGTFLLLQKVDEEWQVIRVQDYVDI